jgi:isohexenylglutaconyl-CoA hydratase
VLPATDEIELERRGEALVIWLNRPDSRNALTATMVAELEAVCTALAAEPALRFVVLRGRGGVFCAGGDLKQFQDVLRGAADRAAIVAANAAFGRLLAAIRALPQLFIVAVEGAAMAGGLGLACAADVTLTTAAARFALTEVTLGLPPAQIAAVLLERVGPGEARRLLLTAQRFDGREAGRLGIAHFVEEDGDALEERLRRLLDEARRCAPGAVGLTRQLIDAAARLEREAMAALAAERFADALLGEEAGEGLRAFAGKRPPAWAGPDD